jgi:hypothetical protein
MCSSSNEVKISRGNKNVEAFTVSDSSKLLKNFFVEKGGAGKGAAFTAKTVKGIDYTYKVVTKEFNGRLYTHVYIEYGYLNFRYLGCYNKFDGKLRHKRKEVEGQSATLISWLLMNTQKGRFSLIEKNVTLYHFGQCTRCARTLTDATSIELGMGPKCRSYS